MGKMDVQIVEYDPKIAVTWGVFFDIPINSSNYFSLAADFYDFEVVDASVIAIDVSLGYKASLYNSQSRVAFRPGLAVGLAYLADPGLVPGGNVLDPQDSVRLDPPQTLGATSYLTIKLFAEAIFISNNTSTFLLDGGFFFAPVGGNHLYDVTVAPSLYLRVGIAY